MIKLIGTNAGLVWRALSKAGRMSVKELKKETKLRTDKELFAAIGWLAKEGKIESGEGSGYLDTFRTYRNTFRGGRNTLGRWF